MLNLVSLKRVLVATLACGTLVATVGNVAYAQTAEDLLAKIRAERTSEQNIARDREARYRTEMEEQRRLTAKVQADKKVAEDRQKRLDNEYDANERKIKELNALLKANLGYLGELFGVTRQMAGDAQTTLGESLVNSQMVAALKPGQEGRTEFLRHIGGATKLPNIKDLERMWLEMLTEMKAGGEVVRYNAPVIVGEELDPSQPAAEGAAPDAKPSVKMKDIVKDMEVVRIGPFMAFADDKYLYYAPSKQKLGYLSRQPESSLISNASALLKNTSESGYVEAIVDPSHGGALMSVYVERPDMLERVNHGEKVVWLTAAVGVLGLLVAAYQYVYLLLAKLAVATQLKSMSKPLANNALGRMLLEVNGTDGHASDKELPEVVELRISESVLREIPKLERFQSFLRLAVAAGPLLGLIGTVIGMIVTFQSITASGTSDPKLMANGIGQAMIATVMGLGVAIPLLFLNAGLVAMSKSVIHVLEEESSSLLGKKLRQQS